MKHSLILLLSPFAPVSLHATSMEDCGVHRLAVLLVGTSNPKSFEKHSALMMRNILKPLKAHVFAVFDAEGPSVHGKMPLRQALPHVVGSALKVVGLVVGGSEHHAQHAALTLGKEFPSTLFKLVRRDPAHPTVWAPYIQWFKLYEAWKLMEAHEETHGGGVYRYDTIVKLRFDCTPGPAWDICSHSDALSPRRQPAGNSSSSSSSSSDDELENRKSGARDFKAIHVLTDKVFYGKRDVMKIACHTWLSIWNVFVAGLPNPMSRPFSVPAMLGSLLSIPREAWGTQLNDDPHWQHYHKACTLPYLDMGIREENPYAQMVRNTRAAYDAGYDFVDPANPPGNARVVRGERASRSDYNRSTFMSEKDFVGVMVGANVTVCDLGGGTDRVLYKGHSHHRPSLPCRSLPAPRLPLPKTTLRPTPVLAQTNLVPPPPPPTAAASLGRSSRHTEAEGEESRGALHGDLPSKRRLSRLAVCFVGQFPRHGALQRSVQRLLGSKHAVDAFVATSTQHTETNPNDKVSHAAVCGNLLRSGFSTCQTALVPYNATEFHQRTQEFEFQLVNGLFPLRVASFFSTVQRCMRMVKEAHDKQWQEVHAESKQKDGNNGGDGYKFIFVTRLDVISGVRSVGFGTAGGLAGHEWWRRAEGRDLVLQRELPPHIKHPRGEDRFFFGKPKWLLPLASIWDDFNTLFARSLDPNHRIPESLLWRYLVEDSAVVARPASSPKVLPKVGKTRDFVSITKFAADDRKYQAGFRNSLIGALGIEKAGDTTLRACGEFSTTPAREACYKEHRKSFLIAARLGYQENSTQLPS